MNPLKIDNFVKNYSNREDLYESIDNIIRNKKYKKDKKFLGEGQNGIVLKLNNNTTVKIFKNANRLCPIKNKYVYFCYSFFNEVSIGLILTKLVENKECQNFLVIKNAFNIKNYGMITRDFADFVFLDFLKNNKKNEDLITNLILQYLLAISILHEKYKGMILDNKFINLYVKKNTSVNKTIKYRIWNKTYELPNMGYLMIIGDYGTSKFEYPYNDKIKTQVVKYTDLKDISKHYNMLEKKVFSKSKHNHYKIYDQINFEKLRQIYLDGLFNPYVEHIYFFTHLIYHRFIDKLGNFNHYKIVNQYIKLTDYKRSGIELMRSNLSAIDLVDKLIETNLFAITRYQ